MAANDFDAEAAVSLLDNAYCMLFQSTKAVRHCVSVVKAFTPKLFSVIVCSLVYAVLQTAEK